MSEQKITDTAKGRAIIEKTELSIKIQKLSAFLKGTEVKKLSLRSRRLLSKQLKYMQKYFDVLSTRLTEWENV